MRSRLSFIVALLIAAASQAHAQDWPSRPMTLVVPFAAGGGVDVSARIQAQGMGERLGQSSACAAKAASSNAPASNARHIFMI